MALRRESPAKSGRVVDSATSSTPLAPCSTARKATPQTDIEFDFFDESPTTESAPKKKKDSPPGKRPRLPKRPPVAAGRAAALPPRRPDRGRDPSRGHLHPRHQQLPRRPEAGRLRGLHRRRERASPPSSADAREAAQQPADDARDQARGAALGRRGAARPAGADPARRRRTSARPGRSSSSRRRSSRRCSSASTASPGSPQGLQLVAQTDDPQESGREPGRPGPAAGRERRHLRRRVQGRRRVGARAAGRHQRRRARRRSSSRTPSSASPTFWTQTVQRLTQGPEAGGLRGNGIAGVRVQPGGQELSQGEDNTVEVTDDLGVRGARSRTRARARRPR